MIRVNRIRVRVVDVLISPPFYRRAGHPFTAIVIVALTVEQEPDAGQRLHIRSPVRRLQVFLDEAQNRLQECLTWIALRVTNNAPIVRRFHQEH
jgi:hypothetical protein